MPNFPNYAQFQAELAHAEFARRDGHEGMARVCARRAAGIIIGEFLRKKGVEVGELNAYARIKYLQSLPEITNETRIVAGHFLMRINPDNSFPVDVDLIADTRWLETRLL